MLYHLKPMMQEAAEQIRSDDVQRIPNVRLTSGMRCSIVEAREIITF